MYYAAYLPPPYRKYLYINRYNRFDFTKDIELKTIFPCLKQVKNALNSVNCFGNVYKLDDSFVCYIYGNECSSKERL